MLIVGDFNLNVDKATATDFYNRLFFIMLEQFIDFPPRIKSHTLDLICTGITPFSSSALDLSIYLTINRSFSAHKRLFRVVLFHVLTLRTLIYRGFLMTLLL